jgi:hypothetical protein
LPGVWGRIWFAPILIDGDRPRELRMSATGGAGQSMA